MTIGREGGLDDTKEAEPKRADNFDKIIKRARGASPIVKARAERVIEDTKMFNEAADSLGADSDWKTLLPEIGRNVVDKSGSWYHAGWKLEDVDELFYVLFGEDIGKK